MALEAATRAKAAGVDVEGVNLSYGQTHVLKDVNLRIEPGEFFAFLGPSGCGKTTLLRLIAGFNIAQTGRVTIGGQDISTLPPWKRDVGMVFQSYALWPHMTVAKNVAFGLEERKVPKADIDRRVKARWSSSASPISRSAGRASSPAASSSAWRWREPSSSSPRSCCSTNPCRTSTPRCASRCGRELRDCSSGWASPPSSSRTIRKRRTRSATASP